MIKRGLSPKSLEEVKREGISGGNIKVIYRIVDAIDRDEAKQIVKAIKELKLKVTPAVQGDEIRVSGRKIDELQQVISAVKKLDLKRRCFSEISNNFPHFLRTGIGFHAFSSSLFPCGKRFIMFFIFPVNFFQRFFRFFHKLILMPYDVI
jgi:hypothetical protein